MSCEDDADRHSRRLSVIFTAAAPAIFGNISVIWQEQKSLYYGRKAETSVPETVDSVYKLLNDLILRDLVKHLAVAEKQPFSCAAGDPYIGIGGFSGSVDGTTHYCDLDSARRMKLAHSAFKFINKRDKVYARTTAGGT